MCIHLNLLLHEHEWGILTDGGGFSASYAVLISVGVAPEVVVGASILLYLLIEGLKNELRASAEFNIPAKKL